jgi:hypothetical protein
MGSSLLVLVKAVRGGGGVGDVPLVTTDTTTTSSSGWPSSLLPYSELLARVSLDSSFSGGEEFVSFELVSNWAAFECDSMVWPSDRFEI